MPEKELLNKAVIKMRVRKCGHCGHEYTIGINGVESGCDECEGIVRNPRDGSIIYEDYSSLFNKGEQS